MNTPRLRPYSLIELLVVIAIIMLLSAIIVPAVNSARNTAKKAQCIANQKNIGEYIHNYAYNNNQSLGVLADYKTWYKGLMVSNGGLEPDDKNGDLTSLSNYTDKYLSDPGNKKITPAGASMAKIFKCPNEPLVERGGGTASYARNDPEGGGTMKWNGKTPDTTKRIVSSRLNDFRGPSELILITDRWSKNHKPGESANSKEYETTNAFHIRPRDKTDKGIQQSDQKRDQVARHKGDAPILYVDGHVTSVNYLQTIPKHFYPPADVEKSGWGNLEKLSWTKNGSGYAVGSWSDDLEAKKSTFKGGD